MFGCNKRQDFGRKRIGRRKCREINAERRRLQNFDFRNGRLEKRTKTDAVQEKICTKTIKYRRSSNQNDYEVMMGATLVTTMHTCVTF